MDASKVPHSKPAKTGQNLYLNGRELGKTLPRLPLRINQLSTVVATCIKILDSIADSKQQLDLTVVSEEEDPVGSKGCTEMQIED